MKKIIIVGCFLMHAYVQSVALVATFVNNSGVNIQAQCSFSDHTIENKGIGIAQSYQVVNFDTKSLNTILLNSPDKDKNGNLYAQCHQNIPSFKDHVTYEITLEKVPAHKVVAAVGTEEFMMPVSEKIVCTLKKNK